MPALFALAGVTYLFELVGVSFQSVLKALDNVVDGTVPVRLVSLVMLWAVTWSVLWGGIISRYTRHPVVRARGFAAACVAHAGVLLRIMLMAAIAWLWLAWLLTSLGVGPSGRPRLPPTPIVVVFVALFIAIYLSLVLARVRAVVDDRRSAVFAILAGWRLVRARPMAVMTLALMGVLLFLAALFMMLLGAMLMLGGNVALKAPFDTLVTGGIMVLALWAELQVTASLVALYEAETAHGAAAWPVEFEPSLVSGMKASLAKD